MKLCGIAFYHPKNPQNVADLASLAAHKRSRLFIVPRPGQEPPVPSMVRGSIVVISDLAEIGRYLDRAGFLVLETYGVRYLHEVELSGECIVIVVGAEDYGVPKDELGKLPGSYVIARIPVAVQGMSYNVVMSAAIAIYELERRVRAGNRGSDVAQ